MDCITCHKKMKEVINYNDGSGAALTRYCEPCDIHVTYLYNCTPFYEVYQNNVKLNEGFGISPFCE